ncbi:extracellular solute-binding protein [Paenibacillus koleovorans]|uniref:extracellular solute-binding protein n=1 Tax=Paenibacillus koleovorans TaxID=121608 RepID=UPI000FD72E5B|nr:extracellular solute-binding protein [Paenibacillus koleovorans]
MKKSLTQIIALSMVSSLVLSACGSKEDDKGSASPSPSASASTGASATPAKEKLTLNWMITVPTNASKLPAADKDFVKKAIESKFNVTLNLEYMVWSTTDYQQKLNMKLASGDTPDMFQAGGAESNTYILDKAVADMTSYVNEKTMPNYFKYWVTQDELKRYAVQNVFMRAPVIFNKNQYFSYYVRKDWLDKLGLKIPTSYDEMIEVMKAFTTKDPDGNGKNDTYGLTAAGNQSSIPIDFPEYYKHNRGPGLFVEGDYFVDSGSSRQMEAILNDIKKTLALGVVDPDWFLNKPGQQWDRAAQGKAGIFFHTNRTAAFDNAANSVQKMTKDVTGINANWQPFHIEGSNGASYAALPGTPFMFGAKTPANKIQRTVEIMDWLVSEEGFLLTHYGQAGVHYTKEGTNIKIDPAAFKRDITDNGSFLDIYAGIAGNINMGPEPLGLKVIDPNETDRDRKILDRLAQVKYTLLGTNVSPIPGLDLAAFRTQMRKYQTQIVFDEKDASNWSKYRQDLMTKYQGKALFEGYAEQVGKAIGKSLKFDSAP